MRTPGRRNGPDGVAHASTTSHVPRSAWPMSGRALLNSSEVPHRLWCSGLSRGHLWMRRPCSAQLRSARPDLSKVLSHRRRSGPSRGNPRLLGAWKRRRCSVRLRSARPALSPALSSVLCRRWRRGPSQVRRWWTAPSLRGVRMCRRCSKPTSVKAAPLPNPSVMSRPRRCSGQQNDRLPSARPAPSPSLSAVPCRRSCNGPQSNRLTSDKPARSPGVSAEPSSRSCSGPSRACPQLRGVRMCRRCSARLTFSRPAPPLDPSTTPRRRWCSGPSRPRPRLLEVRCTTRLTSASSARSLDPLRGLCRQRCSGLSRARRRLRGVRMRRRCSARLTFSRPTPPPDRRRRW